MGIAITEDDAPVKAQDLEDRHRDVTGHQSTASFYLSRGLVEQAVEAMRKRHIAKVELAKAELKYFTQNVDKI